VDSLCDELKKLVLYSKTNSTWAKHSAGWRLFEEYVVTYNTSAQWPVSIPNARSFVVWALKSKKLKASTVKTYLSSLKLAHTLKNLPCPEYLNDDIIKMSLKGAANLECISGNSTIMRAPMTIDILQIIGHRIAESNWKKFSKQVVWTVFLINFFTACRTGELVCPTENSFDSHTSLLWKHVTLYDDYATIYIPYTKTKGFKGHTLEIFPFTIDSCCPLSALKIMEKMSKNSGIWDENLPVFTFQSGKFVTIGKLNDTLNIMLSDITEGKTVKYTCHSFRAGIPSLISSYPDKNYIADILEWGEWNSPTWKLYAKSSHNRKKFLFDKVSSVICNSLK
jgi:hypothetical protein